MEMHTFFKTFSRVHENLMNIRFMDGTRVPGPPLVSAQVSLDFTDFNVCHKDNNLTPGV